MATQGMNPAEVGSTTGTARLPVLLYGVTTYALFQVVFLYLMAFVVNLVPYSVDRGVAAPVATAVVIDLALLALFAVQHTIMARGPFKSWLTRYLPAAAERSTFVLVTCAVLIPLYVFWRPIPAVVWDVEGTALRAVVWGVCGAGWLLLLVATFMIDHFDLFGLRQVWLHFRGRPYTPPPFMTRGAYRYVRHPIMVGMLIGFWVTPTMTVGHLLFAAGFTVYIWMGTQFEERDLARHLGDTYRRYQEAVPKLLPRLTAAPKQ
jgi:protein-S-isoprenylcysteine O-methyltransferase Ste14